MGVRKLKHLLVKNYYKQFPENINIIAIDVSIWLYKYIKGKCQEPLYLVFNMTCKFLSEGIIPLFVFDGKPITEKNNEINKRIIKKQKMKLKVEELKNKLNINPDDESIKKELNRMLKKSSSISIKLINNCKLLMNLMKVPYIEARTEADFTCCRLYLDGIVDACLTEDMDFLLLGCNRTFHFEKGQIVEYNLNDSLNNLELTFSQFQDFCLLLGCDYVKKFLLDDASAILNNLKNKNSIENMLNETINKEQKINFLKCIKIKKILNSILDNEKLEIETYKLVYNNESIEINDLQKFFSSKINENSFKYHQTATFNNFVRKVNSYKFLNSF